MIKYNGRKANAIPSSAMMVGCWYAFQDKSGILCAMENNKVLIITTIGTPYIISTVHIQNVVCIDTPTITVNML